MQLFAVAIDRQRHERHRQQRQQGQLPADLRGHDDQHRAAHYQRVHQRQHPFPGGKDHAIDVVSRARDKIPGAMAQIKFGMLSTQLAIKIFTQLNGQLIGRTKQQHAPDVAQQINNDRRQHQRANPHQHPCGGVMLFGDAIHDVAHHFRRDQLQDSNDNKQGDCTEVALPLPTKVPA